MNCGHAVCCNECKSDINEYCNICGVKISYLINANHHDIDDHFSRQLSSIKEEEFEKASNVIEVDSDKEEEVKDKNNRPQYNIHSDRSSDEDGHTLSNDNTKPVPVYVNTKQTKSTNSIQPVMPNRMHQQMRIQQSYNHNAHRMQNEIAEEDSSINHKTINKTQIKEEYEMNESSESNMASESIHLNNKKELEEDEESVDINKSKPKDYRISSIKNDDTKVKSNNIITPDDSESASYHT